MSINSKLDRLKERRDQLIIERGNQLRCGQYLVATKTTDKIKHVEAAIEEAESYLPRKLSELFDKETLHKSGILNAIVKVHLAADFLAFCAYDLRDRFTALGVEENHLLPLLDEIKKRSQDFASIVCHPEFAGLSDFIVTNDEFIDNMHKITQQYIDDHLVIT